MMDPKKARERENSLQPERGASLVTKTGMAYLAEGMACANTQRRETSVPWETAGVRWLWQNRSVRGPGVKR